MARSQIVLHSRYADKPSPIDSVTAEFHDTDTVSVEAKEAKNQGFGGNLIIYSAQELQAKRGFAPSPADVAWAESVVQIVEKCGSVAIAADESMTDRPVEIRARHIIERAGTIG